MHWQKLGLTKIETSQEARRLVVAEYQHIVYREWLPIVLGNNFMRVYGLNPLSEVGYDRTFKSTQVLYSVQRVPEPDPIPGISFDTRPDPIQFRKSSGSG